MAKKEKSPAFNPGDAVLSDDFGPLMRVVDVGLHTGGVWCQWFDAAGIRHEASLPAAVLYRADHDWFRRRFNRHQR